MRWAALSKLYRSIAFAIVLASPSAAKGASAYIQVSPTHGTVIYEEQPLNAVVSVTPSGGGYDATRFGGSVSYVDKNGALIGLGYASGYAAGAWSSPMGANVQLAGIAAPGLYELKFEGLVEHLGYFDYLNPQAVWGRPENFSTTVTVEVFEQPLADPNTALSNMDNTKNAQISVSNGTFSGAPVDTRTIQTRICQFFTTGSQQVFFDSIVIRDRNDADAPIYYVRLQGTSLNRLLKRGQNVGKYYTEYVPFADEGRILLQPNTEYAVVMEPYAVPPFTATFEATSEKLSYRTTLGWTLGRTETVTADSGGYDPGGGYDPIYVPPSSITTVSPAAPFFSISATPTGGYDGFPLEGAASLHPFNPAAAANWSAGGAEWSVDTTTTHDGVDSVRAQTTNGQSTYREYTVTGPAVVDFWWKVSSEQLYDTFSYSLNGVNQETISGEVDWSYRTLTLPAGTHTIRWTYTKDASDAVGQDAGWLDDFAVYPATPTLRVRDGSTVLNGAVTVDFGDANIGSAGFTKSLNLTNEGYVPQEVELSLPPSSPFTFEGGSSTYVTLIGRGESVNVPIYLATQSTGTKTALLSISALNSTAAPPQVTLTGDVRGPVIGVSLGSTTLTSGQMVDMGLAPKTLEFTIRNNGNTGNLTPQVSATGNFQIVQQPSASVAPQGSTTFKVMAQSGAFGPQTGSVVVTSNDGFTPTFTINLTSKAFFGIGSGISQGTVATSGTGGASGWDFGSTQLPSGSTGQAIKTGTTPNNGGSVLEMVAQTAGVVSWSWKVSSQENFDWLLCEVDGQEVAGISTKNGVWQTQVVNVPAGANIRWVYRKDASASAGEDAGYLADVEFRSLGANQPFSLWADMNGASDPQQRMPKSGMQAMFAWLGGFDPTVGPAAGHHVPIMEGGRLKYRFAMSKTADGTQQIQFSSDLVNWTTRGMSQRILSEDGDRMIVEATAPSGTKGFFKVVGSGDTSGIMVRVQGGTLPQSSDWAGATVATFQVSNTEVTWRVWQEVRDWAVNSGYIDLAGVGVGIKGNHPVRGVSFNDALKWCNARSEKEGLTPVYEVNGATYRTGEDFPSANANANGYRLPNAIEWEWAASGGVLSKGYIYSGSNDLNAVAWANDPSAKEPKPVGTKAANELGIHDMCGNVWEWTFLPTFHRGGCWIDSYGEFWFNVRSVGQGWPGHGPEYFGLRVARNAED